MLTLTENWADEIGRSRLRASSRTLMESAVRRLLGLDPEWPPVAESEWNALVLDTVGGVEVMGERVRIHHDSGRPKWRLILVSMENEVAA